MKVLLVSFYGSYVGTELNISEVTGILDLMEQSCVSVPEAPPQIPKLCDLMPRFGIGCSAIVEERVEQLSEAQARRFSSPRVSQSTIELMTALKAIFRRKNHWLIMNIR